MADFFESLGDTFITGLNRGIDNATRADPQPSPNTQTNADLNVVKTNDNQTGQAKRAGTGTFLSGVTPAYITLALGGLAAIGILIAVIKR